MHVPCRLMLHGFDNTRMRVAERIDAQPGYAVKIFAAVCSMNIDSGSRRYFADRKPVIGRKENFFFAFGESHANFFFQY